MNVPEKKTTLLRKALAEGRALLVGGAHNGMSAKLVEEAGFDAIWASGFEISAAQAVPDANILTMADTLDAARSMNESTSIPIIADCDTGYGNAVNVIRCVQQFEAAGIAGVCIEDNIFPKRCSFYSSVKRELVSVEEHAGKIRAAKAAQSDPDFFVIARTEALIAGWGQEEAMKRAEAYADAGADAVLIHSKSKTPDEVLTFASRWKKNIPLVAVPTTYSTVSATTLREAGFHFVIYANHGLRAAIHAAREVLTKIRKAERADAADDQIVPLKEVYRLVGVPELQNEEKDFLPKGDPPTRAIILAAGYQPHLGDLIKDVPKSQLEIKGKTILDRQLNALNRCEVNQISVVRGYQKDKIQLPTITAFDNDRYESTGEVYSLWCARDHIEGKTLLMYGDIVFDSSVIERLMENAADITLLVDRSWQDEPAGSRSPEAKPDLVIETPKPTTSRRYVPSTETRKVVAIGSHLSPEEAHSEFVGILHLSEKGAETVRTVLNELKEKGWDAPLQESASLETANLTDLLQELIKQGHDVKTVEIYKGWMEVDSFEDYQRAWSMLS